MNTGPTTSSADGSAAEVKRLGGYLFEDAPPPSGMLDNDQYTYYVLASAFDELRSAFDDRVRVIEMQLEDKKRLASRVAELERVLKEARIVVRHAGDGPTTNALVARIDAALSKGSQP